MPTAKLTDRLLKNLKTKETVEEYWDQSFPGSFGVRVMKSGRKTFTFMYRTHGRRRKMKMGTYPALSLAKARQQAFSLLGTVERGEDPAEKRKQDRTAGTFEELAQIYLGLGDDERTLDVLEKAGGASVSFQPYLWPEYERLSSQPRFLRILKRPGYPSQR